jgi:superfamily II DNA or RNA helicase
MGEQLQLNFGPRPAKPAPVSRRVPRDYQRAAIDAAHARFAAGDRSTAIVLHCGAGKTLTMAEWLRESIESKAGSRGLWLANRDFLLKDARKRLHEQTGVTIGLEKAEWRAGGERIVCGSLQTLVGKRLKQWDPESFDFIVGDEFHHFASPGANAVLDHFAKARVLGGTATLKRHDKVGMHNVCDSIAYERGIDVGIEDGYFVPIVPIARFIDGIKLDKVKTTAGDLNLGDLEEEIAKEAGAIAKLAAEEMGTRPTIIYTPGVASAHAVAEALAKMGKTAHAVDADTPEIVRDEVLRAFDAGELQFIVNCGIYLEGLDVPNCKGIVIARPTKSESLYIQMAGRGGRPEGWIGGLGTRDARVEAIRTSGKPNFILLDITGHAGRHSLCSAATLAGKASKTEVEEAKKILEANEGMTLGEAIKEAGRREARRIAEAAANAEVEARRASFDPFVRHDVKKPDGIAPRWHADPMTDGQAYILKDNLVPLDGMTKGSASLLITQIKKWEAEGRATMRQRQILAPLGLPFDLPFKVAGELIQAVRDNRSQAPSAEVIARIVGAERVPGMEG